MCMEIGPAIKLRALTALLSPPFEATKIKPALPISSDNNQSVKGRLLLF